MQSLLFSEAYAIGRCWLELKRPQEIELGSIKPERSEGLIHVGKASKASILK
jgi:hypothetical protein